MSTKERQPYHPPEITRVALRHEQAILSQCSTRVQLYRCSHANADRV